LTYYFSGYILFSRSNKITLGGIKMKNLAGLEVSNLIFETIEKRVEVSRTEPYVFIIHGVNAVGGKLKSAYSALKKIEKWAVANGAEVNLIEEIDFSLKVEITDPVAARVESHYRASDLKYRA